MNIVAIGGGDRTPAVDRALELNGSERSNVLIIPTAASTEASYNRKTTNLVDFFTDKGIVPNVLHKFGEMPPREQLEYAIGSATLLYTFGGNSPYMIRTMQEHGLQKIIRNAITSGTVHAGLSAGALLPFAHIHSNPEAKPAEKDWDYTYLKPGVNIIPAAATAHAEQHDMTPNGRRSDSRMEDLVDTLPREVDRGFAINNGAAAIFGANAEIILADPKAGVHYVFRNEHGQVQTREAVLGDLALH